MFRGAQKLRWALGCVRWQLLGFTAPIVAYSDQSVVWCLRVGLIDKWHTEPPFGR